VVNDVSFDVKQGEIVGLLGPNGAGKTTITNLINRFYDIQDGKIRYDGINVNKIKKADLRRSLGIVLQETHLFTGTVMENIRYGKLTASDEECIEAAKLAGAHDFISHLPEGYNTVIAGNASNLSQGQRQLLSIARVAVADPPVMILDEATAFIDPENEQKMEAAIREIVKGKTVIVIAHRMHQIQNADRIIVLNQGRVEAVGRHNALIKECPLYQTLWRQSEESGNWSLSQGGTGI